MEEFERRRSFRIAELTLVDRSCRGKDFFEFRCVSWLPVRRWLFRFAVANLEARSAVNTRRVVLEEVFVFQLGEDAAGTSHHTVGGCGHLVDVATAPRRYIGEAVSGAVDPKGGAHHVGDGFGFDLDDATAVGSAFCGRFVEPDVGELVNRRLEPLGAGQAGAHDHVSLLPVGDPVGLAEPVYVGDLETESGSRDQFTDPIPAGR